MKALQMPRLLIMIMIVIGVLCTASVTADDESWSAHYLANSGVMVARGDTKILFDPFFRQGFGEYDLVPPQIEAALFAGEAPWGSIDAIFISHHHGDHFEPAVVMRFLKTWTDVALYAPQQAVDALLVLDDAPSDALMNRIHSINLERDSAAARLDMEGLLVEAVRVAHGGWPDRHGDVENIVFRVTLDNATTVMHLGDADGGNEHYEPHRSFWQERKTDLALLPVWLFLTDKGRYVLDEHIDAEHELGIHVFKSVADDSASRAPEFEGLDIFTQPGESRDWQQ